MRTRPGPWSLVAVALLIATLTSAGGAAGQEPAPSATSSGRPEPVAPVVAVHAVLLDDFSTPGAWGTGDQGTAAVAYDQGALALTLATDASSITSTRRPPQASPAMRLSASFTFSADGSSGGPMCGSAADGGDHAFAVTSTSGQWTIGRLHAGGASILASGTLGDLDVTTGAPVRLAIECIGSGEDGRIVFSAEGRTIADVPSGGPVGPYDRVGAYADSATGGAMVRVDDAAISDAGPVPGTVTLGAATDVLPGGLFTAEAFEPSDDGSVRVTPADGSLAVSFGEADLSRWLWRPTGRPADALRVELEVAADAEGVAGGPICVTADETPDVVFATLAAPGAWAVGRIVQGSPRIIIRGSTDTTLAPGSSHEVALECALTDEGERVALWIDGQLTADVTGTTRHGPYTAAGVYAETSQPGTTVRFASSATLVGRPVSTLTTLGASEVLLQDPFEDGATWSTGKAATGRVAYANDALAMTVSRPGTGLWDWKMLAQPAAVVRIESLARMGKGAGAVGLLCGAPDSDAFHVAVVTTSGQVVVGHGDAAGIDILDSRPLPDGVAPGRAYRLALECAAIGDGSDRVVVWVDGTLAADVTAAPLGPLGKAGLYVEGGKKRFTGTFDDALIARGDAYAPDGESTIGER